MDAVAAVDEMLSFMKAHKLAEDIDLKVLINEGRA
jgi:hypothetical protein